MPKYDFQITTGQFEFIHGEIEGTPEDAVEAFKALKLAFNGGSGLGDREWNKFLDSYLATGSITGDPGELANLSKAQAWLINEIKKSKKRTS